MKHTLYVHDVLFQHAKTSSWYNESELFDWKREYDKDFLVFTDDSIFEFNSFNNQRKYAWLVESPEINPKIYNYIKENYNKFDIIFTFDKDLLSISSKFELVPFGGCWIYDLDRKIHPKTKLISSILSPKRITSGHILRHQIKETFTRVDYFGYPNFIENKIQGLKDYCFSIVVENTKKDYYFTEKLIDCFITGTIPIYWGCPSISNFFDLDGFFTFDNIDELNLIMSSLSQDLYNSKLKFVKENFERAKNYLIGDELLFNILKDKEGL